jgi:hypothetical protein
MNDEAVDMGVRESVNKLNPKVAASICCAMIAVAGGIVWWASRESPVGVGPTVFYTVDDGKTFFLDAANRTVPFATPDGKEAVRAFVFRAEGKEPYVGYLQKFSPEASKRYTGEGFAEFMRSLRDDEVFFKSPGESSWHQRGSPGHKAALAKSAAPGAVAVIAGR